MNAPTIINHVQHSAEWHAHRASHFNASDVAAMLNISPYMARGDLLDYYARGVPEDIEPAKQKIFDAGHRYEAQARPWAEEIIGEELYPVTMAREVEGLKLSASLDGLTLAGDLEWEHKTLNATILEALGNGELPEYHRAQMEQQLIVSGAEKALFMASKGNRETMRFAWYESDPAMRARILAGWKQFARDLANYKPTVTTPAPVAQPIQALPALMVEIEGRVISTNLDRFQAAAKALISAIKTDLSSDQDFSDAEATVKFCKDAEGRLETVKAQALAQTATIDEVFRVMDGLKEELRSKRLTLEKAVKVRKDEVRAELIMAAWEDLLQHTQALEAGLEGKWLNIPVRQTLGEAIKGRKSVSSCRDALSVRVGQLRTELSNQADQLKRNRAALRIDGRDWYSLFPDFSAIGLRDDEEFDALAELRIRKHLEAEAEATRLKLEAKARAQSEAEIRAKAEAAAQAQAEAEARAQAEANHRAACAEIGAMVRANQAEAEAEPITREALADTLARMHAAMQDDQPPEEMTIPADMEWHATIEGFIAARQFGKDAGFIRAILQDFSIFALGFRA